MEKVEQELRKIGHHKDLEDVFTESIEASTMHLSKKYSNAMRMQFTLKDLSGRASVFESFRIRLVCKHDYLVTSTEESKEGRFYFERPLMLAPDYQLKVEMRANAWIMQQIRNMRRALSKDTIQLQITLEGYNLDWQPLLVGTTGSI